MELIGELTYDEYVHIVKFMEQNPDEGEDSITIQLISHFQNIPIKDIEDWDVEKYIDEKNKLWTTIKSIGDSNEIVKEFTFNDKNYKVDHSVMMCNVRLLRDKGTIMKKYGSDPWQLSKHIVAMTFYSDDMNEKYDLLRYKRNLNVVGKLPARIVKNISNFFLHLSNLYTQLSQQSLTLLEMNQKLEFILTELSKASTKDTQESIN
jgi:hypothetical protein